MGGLDWTALPVVVEMFGIMDVETFVIQLVSIRTWRRAQEQAAQEEQ